MGVIVLECDEYGGVLKSISVSFLNWGNIDAPPLLLRGRFFSGTIVSCCCGRVVPSISSNRNGLDLRFELHVGQNCCFFSSFISARSDLTTSLRLAISWFLVCSCWSMNMLVDMLVFVILLSGERVADEELEVGVDAAVVLLVLVGAVVALPLLLFVLLLLALFGVHEADFDSCSIILRSAAFRSRYAFCAARFWFFRLAPESALLFPLLLLLLLLLLLAEDGFRPGLGRGGRTHFFDVQMVIGTFLVRSAVCCSWLWRL